MRSTLRDIAVFLDASPAGAAIGRHAARLAARHHAHLVGVYGVSREEHRHAAESYARGSDAIREVMARRRKEDERKALEAGRCVGGLAREYGISSELRVVLSDGPDHGAALRSLHCDLIVAAHPGQDGAPTLWSAEQLWLATGIPLLLVPQDWSGESIGEKVLIAWNRSRQARRAVADALPFIQNASHTTVLVVDGARDPVHFGDAPGANLVGHLSRHGAQVELAAVDSQGAPVAEVILDQCVQQGADLLVIGAYSRSRATELLFGGTTRSLLTGTPLPLLVSG